MTDPDSTLLHDFGATRPTLKPVPAGQAASPFLRLCGPGAGNSAFALQGDRIVIGRGPQADVRLPESLSFVAALHAEVRRTPTGYVIIDLGSPHGTRLNGQPLVPGQPVALRPDDMIRLGDERLGVSLGLAFCLPQPVPVPLAGYAPAANDLPTVVSQKVARQAAVTIGRDPNCDIVLDAPTVSRQHARLVREGDQYLLEDTGSANGTYVNGQRITRSRLHAGDLVHIQQHLLIFQNGELRRYDSYGMRVDVIGLGQTIRTRQGPRPILADVDLTLLPREFVALVGGSGAGKSTLLNALVGRRPASQGQILLNGRGFYQELQRFRSQLGYVPQADILHTALTVERALDYTAQLRLPRDVNAAERRRRIAAVLDTVGLNTEAVRRTRVGQLSGGQRKRVSIAAELLADPKLFLLDEPTSGLDPGLEKKMMHTLRRMADEGRTIVLITHATANIVQVDHVAFLSDGRLVFFGPPEEALPFFEVREFADIYDRLAGRGAEWREAFVSRQPEAYQRYVAARQASRALTNAGPPAPGPRPGGLLRQVRVLTQRALSLLTTDLVTLCLLLLLFPLTAALQLTVGSRDVLTGNLAILANPAAAAEQRTESYLPFPPTNTFVFAMGLQAVLIGMYVPSNELIKERSIYLRERMVNLQVPAYLLSKVAIFTAFAVLQTLLYLLILSIGIDLPARGQLLPGPMELFITLLLTLLAGVGLGLLVSAVARSTDMAIYALVLMMFFQFFFSGAGFDLRGNPLEALSYLTATRWSMTGIGVTIDMPRIVESTIVCNTLPDDPRTPQVETHVACINYRDAVNDLLLSYEDGKLAQSWAVLAGTALGALVLTGVFIKRLDQL